MILFGAGEAAGVEEEIMSYQRASRLLYLGRGHLKGYSILSILNSFES